MRVGRCDSRSIDSPTFRPSAFDNGRGAVVELVGDLGAQAGPVPRDAAGLVVQSGGGRVCVDLGLVLPPDSSGWRCSSADPSALELTVASWVRRCVECWTRLTECIPAGVCAGAFGAGQNAGR
jgi:hypothetical protein